MSLKRIEFRTTHPLIQIDREVLDGIFLRNDNQLVIVVSYEKAQKSNKGVLTFLPRKEVE